MTQPQTLFSMFDRELTLFISVREHTIVVKVKRVCLPQISLIIYRSRIKYNPCFRIFFSDN